MQERTPASRQIGSVEAESFRVLPGRADAGLIMLCDHAANALPAAYGSLGLDQRQFERHIAYDIGAAALTEAVARAFDAPAVMTRYSRLLIDPNRGLDDPTLIMRLSDGAIVPGNRHLDAAERDRRVRLYYRPYHRAITQLIDQCLAAGPVPALLSIHSFTESWKGIARPWHVGVLYAHDDRLARLLIESFAGDGTLIVGDNEPYRGSLQGDCMWQHGTQRGLAHALIEVRQDLIRDAAGQASWSERIIGVIDELRRRPDVQLNCSELPRSDAPERNTP